MFEIQSIIQLDDLPVTREGGMIALYVEFEFPSKTKTNNVRLLYAIVYFTSILQ